MSRAPFPAAFDYVGVPYLEHGRTPARWDCYGLVYYLSRRYLHHNVPSYLLSYVDAESADGAFIEHLGEWQRVELPAVELGDVLVLTVVGQPTHCGLVVSDDAMLHCMRARDTVLERFASPAWARRIEGAYRWT